MTDDKLLVLTEKQIKQKIQRIAHEIYENHYQEKELVIVVDILWRQINALYNDGENIYYRYSYPYSTKKYS